MRQPAPLPCELRRGVFTSAQARALGVGADRLRRSDVERVRHGLHRWVDPATEGGAQGREPPSLDTLTAAETRLLLSHTDPDPQARPDPTVVASRTTAARLQTIWLPDRLRPDRVLHLTRPADAPRLRAPGVSTHREALATADIRLLQVPGPDGGPPGQLHVTGPVRTWLDLVSTLTPIELVILGDWLVLSSGPGRAWAHCTPGDLVEAASTPGRRGAVRARQAAALIRDGAHSPPETELRLALVAAGLPEPELQITERDPDAPHHQPTSADLGWRGPRVVVQYEGGGHDDPVQVARDTQRDRVFMRLSYLVIRASRSDRSRGFATTVDLVRQALRERGG